MGSLDWRIQEVEICIVVTTSNFSRNSSSIINFMTLGDLLWIRLAGCNRDAGLAN